MSVYLVTGDWFLWSDLLVGVGPSAVLPAKLFIKPHGILYEPLDVNGDGDCMLARHAKLQE